MADSTDILWNFYQEHCAWERHHEEQRASVTNILLVVAAGVLSVITFDGISRSDLPLTIFLIMQGLFGALFVAKQYERFARHQRLVGKYRQALNDRFPESQIIALREQADKEHKEKYRILSDEVRLHQLWVGLHLLIALFGVVLTGFVLAAPFKSV
jgi:hypothetical protein